MRLLHDGEPRQQRLQVALTGQVVVKRLNANERLASRPGGFLREDGVSPSRLTVMICALSSAERVDELGLALNSLWKACMAPAVTSWAKQAEQPDLLKKKKKNSGGFGAV